MYLFTHNLYYMAKPLKEYSPALQLVLILSLFIGFVVLASLFDMIISPALTGYDSTALREADVSHPGVTLTWKILAFSDMVFMYLLPALVFSRLISHRPIEWLHLNKQLGLQPAIFVTIFILLSIPVCGVLYDWNSTWGIAQSSLQRAEKFLATSDAIMKMPNFAYLLLDLIVFALVPAIARELFFRGVLQQVLIKMMPKTPWIAIIITAAVFSASYFQFQYFAAVFLVGLQLGAIYYLSGNLRLTILGEFILSSVNFIESYFFQIGWTNEDPVRPSPTPWYTAAVSLIITIGLLWYYRKRIPRPAVIPAYQNDVESIGK